MFALLDLVNESLALLRERQDLEVTLFLLAYNSRPGATLAHLEYDWLYLAHPDWLTYQE